MCYEQQQKPVLGGKEAHTKVEKKSRSEKIHMEKSYGCMMQDRLNCVFLRWEVGCWDLCLVLCR